MDTSVLGIVRPAFGGANSICQFDGAVEACAGDSEVEQFFGAALHPSNTTAGGAGLPNSAAWSGQNPPPNEGSTTQVSGEPPYRVFLRLPTGEDRRLWPGAPLNYWKLRRLISPGPWNDNAAPVRAYELRKMGATRGIVLIEHLDLIRWWNACFQKSGISVPPLVEPQVILPPVLHVPPPGEECPYTSIRHTIMFELARPYSAFGQTHIYVAHYLLPGSAAKAIAIETQSLLRYIRSLPPPHYKIPLNMQPPAGKRARRKSPPRRQPPS